jgi:hypothetical protein
MVADIARVTYDPTRQYRSVLFQQGRVTLEADNNEAEIIEGEALRLETIDIVGPAGTPDNGYEISSGTGPAGFDVGKGIFYLGGWRLELDAEKKEAGGANDKTLIEWVRGQQDFVVCLLITERSIGAVEDQALREVALGGPDSAARSRLMQTFPRVATDGNTCAVGATSVAAVLSAEGVTIDPYSDQLISSATLQAGFTPGPASTDPCQPAAAGGYLGADNQMVRVTVTAFDAKKQSGALLWGWNNASLLYRATANDPLTLTLTTVPVDDEHAPQQNQMVEILGVDLDLEDGNYIADGEGFVVSLAQGYSSDTGQIILSSPLPAKYQNSKTPLFVRLWQAEVPFSAGVQTPLDAVSGITVAISMTALPTRIAARPFWRFAVRPATPTSIYPQRYLDAPQPPDGPRQWICDLAICEALDEGCTVLEDCRPKFGPLTGLTGGCCGVTIGPSDNLQAAVDSLAGGPAVLSLMPGTYDLAAPLKLTKANDGLTIEACGGGVIIQSSATDTTGFNQGLIQLTLVRNITLRGLELLPPEAPMDPKTKISELSMVCGVGVNGARELTIEDCTIELTAQAKIPFGVGIIAYGVAVDVSLCNNTIVATSAGDFIGIAGAFSSTNASSEIELWNVTGNRFSRCIAGVFVYAKFGFVSCRENYIVDCGAGIVLLDANQGSLSGFTQGALTNNDNAHEMALGRAGYALLRPDILGSIVDKTSTIIPPAQSESTISDAARKVLADQMQASGLEALKSYTAGLGAPGAAADVQAPGVDAASFDKINNYSVGGEVYETNLTAAVRIEDNEITLVDGIGVAIAGLAGDSGSAAPWIGIGVSMSRDEVGSVMVSGNRVVVPDATTTACGLAFPTAAVVTGNLFAQLQLTATGAPGLPALMVMTMGPAAMVSANLASFTELILPQRSSAAATSTWDFLNTTA